MILTKAEVEHLAKDPYVLKVLIDAYKGGDLADNPWEPRLPTIEGMYAFSPPVALCKLLGGCGGMEYDKARKVVATYKEHFASPGNHRQ